MQLDVLWSGSCPTCTHFTGSTTAILPKSYHYVRTHININPTTLITMGTVPVISWLTPESPFPLSES